MYIYNIYNVNIKLCSTYVFIVQFRRARTDTSNKHTSKIIYHCSKSNHRLQFGNQNNSVPINQYVMCKQLSVNMIPVVCELINHSISTLQSPFHQLYLKCLFGNLANTCHAAIRDRGKYGYRSLCDMIL